MDRILRTRSETHGADLRGLAVLALAAGTIGCGGSDAKTTTAPKAPVGGDERAILETVDILQTAARAGDGRRICADVFTAALAKAVMRAADRSCAREVRENLFRPDESIAVQRGIKVAGGAATAVIREQNGNVSTLHMLRQANGWRVARIAPEGAS